MAEHSEVLTEAGWGPKETVIMTAALVGLAIPWLLTVVAPPDGLVPWYGIVISLAAGIGLAFWIFGYLRY